MRITIESAHQVIFHLLQTQYSSLRVLIVLAQPCIEKVLVDKLEARVKTLSQVVTLIFFLNLYLLFTLNRRSDLLPQRFDVPVLDPELLLLHQLSQLLDSNVGLRCLVKQDKGSFYAYYSFKIVRLQKSEAAINYFLRVPSKASPALNSAFIPFIIKRSQTFKDA